MFNVMCLFACKCVFRCKLCLKMICFVSESHVIQPLVTKASARLNKAFRPKTQVSYTAMFEIFIAFCIRMKVELLKLNISTVLAFLECLLHD